MHGNTSFLHAIASGLRPREGCLFTRLVDAHGHFLAGIELDAEALRLRAGRPQEVRILLFEPGSIGGNHLPRPIRTADGRHALAHTQTVTAGAGERFLDVAVDVTVRGYENQWVDLVVERAHTRAPLVAAGLAALAVTAGLALATWGDPAARRGHYEGKTDEEIQADLDADVAWYAMEISVASAMTVAEGQTTIEARIENPEANHCDQKVRILTAEGEELYASGALHPGEYLQTVELAHPLALGTHTLTVEFQGYEQAPTLLSDEGVPLGHDTFGASCAAQVELTVVPRAS